MVPEKVGAQKNPQGTFRSKNTAASRGGPDASHHTAKRMHLLCLTLGKDIFQRVRSCVISQLLVLGRVIHLN